MMLGRKCGLRSIPLWWSLWDDIFFVVVYLRIEICVCFPFWFGNFFVVWNISVFYVHAYLVLEEEFVKYGYFAFSNILLLILLLGKLCLGWISLRASSFCGTIKIASN